jgi:release factor glutamine methyltransferase
VGGTVGALLGWASDALRASGSDTARLDAELLLGHVLGVERTAVLAHPEARVGDGPEAAFRGLVARRERGEPVAYIRGVKEFHGLAFSVDPRALIPRPDTELLVDLAVDALRERLVGSPRPVGSPRLRVWDVGTGSGAVAIAVATALRRGRYLDEVEILMSDISPEALRLAVENAVGHGVADRLSAAVGDLLSVEPPPDRLADLVLANLPYIPSGTVPTLPIAASFEPRIALDGGPDGLDLVRRLLRDLPSVIAPGGRALVEIGSDQAGAVEAEARTALPEWAIAIVPDLGGRPRVARLDAPRS